MIIPTNISFDLSSLLIALEYHFNKGDTIEFNKTLKYLRENFYKLNQQQNEDKAEINRLKTLLESQVGLNKEFKKSLSASHDYYQANLEVFIKLKQHIEQIQNIKTISELPELLIDIQTSMQVQRVKLILDKQKFSTGKPSAISLISREKIQTISNHYQEHYKTNIVHGLCSQVLDKEYLSAAINNLNQNISDHGSCFLYIINDKYNPESAIGIFALSDSDPERFSQEKATDYLAHFSQILGNSVLSLWDRQKLDSQRKELERSNSELEQFAYVASHDLQEPLRKIQVFGDRLRVKQYQVLDEQGKDYLERMQNAARRMKTMINDLLSFSRIT
ncbi:MAG: sensor histidine kinase, partial [Thermodesulfobacteriota bacterium]